MTDSADTPPEDTGESDSSPVVAQYSWADTKPSMAVIETVAEVLEKRPLDLTPLYYAIDPTTLDDVLTDPGARNVPVTFDYAGVEVTVTDAGQVTVTPDGDE